MILSPLQAQSTNARNQLKLARSAADQGKWDDARKYCDRALADEPSYVDALYMRAFAYRELGEYAKAETDFLNVIKQNPTFIGTYGGLADTYMRQKQYDKADKVFIDLSKQPEGAKWASYYRGVVAYLQGDLKKAEQFWRDTLNQDSGFVPAIHNLGALFLAQNNYPAALAKFREALTKKPDEALYKFHLAWALERAGRMDEAQALLKDLIAKDAEDRQFWLLGQALDRMNKKRYDGEGGALPMLKTVSEEHPTNLDVWILLGRTYLALNRPEEARAALTKAKELDGAFQEVKDLMAKLPTPSEPPQPEKVAPQSEGE